MKHKHHDLIVQWAADTSLKVEVFNTAYNECLQAMRQEREAMNKTYPMTDAEIKSALERENAQLKAVIEQQKEVIERQTNCIRGLTDQCAALVVEKNSLLMDHGGALCDKAKFDFLNGIIAADGALITGLKNDIEDQSALIETLASALSHHLHMTRPIQSTTESQSTDFHQVDLLPTMGS